MAQQKGIAGTLSTLVETPRPHPAHDGFSLKCRGEFKTSLLTTQTCADISQNISSKEDAILKAGR